MSRLIDLNAPLSDDDRAYLEAWSRHVDIINNDRRFGELSDEEKAEAAAQAESDAEVDAQRLADATEVPDEEFDADLLEEIANLDTGDIRLRLQKLGLASEGDRDDIELRLLEKLQGDRDSES